MFLKNARKAAQNSKIVIEKFPCLKYKIFYVLLYIFTDDCCLPHPYDCSKVNVGCILLWMVPRWMFVSSLYLRIVIGEYWFHHVRMIPRWILVASCLGWFEDECWLHHINAQDGSKVNIFASCLGWLQGENVCIMPRMVPRWILFASCLGWFQGSGCIIPRMVPRWIFFASFLGWFQCENVLHHA